MQLIMFTKHLEGLDIPALVAEAGNSGLDGYDLAVRKGHAVNEENASTALGEVVKAMASEGMSVPMCTGEGSLIDPDAPVAERIAAAMSENGVRFLKLGYHRFDHTKQDYWQEVDRIRKLFEKWERLGEKHDITVCYHTHSSSYMGLNAGCLMHLLRGRNPQYMAGYLDVGHLSMCGAEFPHACAMLGDYLKIVSLKELKKTNAAIPDLSGLEKDVLGG